MSSSDRWLFAIHFAVMVIGLGFLATMVYLTSRQVAHVADLLIRLHQ
jgi:2-iminoacetate synthase ThiH